MTEHDPVLRRVESTSIVACGVMAAIAAAIAGGSIAAALGVIAGGALVAISYRGLKSGIDTLAGARPTVESFVTTAQKRRKTAAALVKFFTRYAILALAAYVIMARLRLPPVAVVAGASSLVVAIMIEALRGVVSGQRPNAGG
jgi:hypothetical protein